MLDECTSNMSLELEEKLYSHAAAIGTTVFSVSHRSSVSVRRRGLRMLVTDPAARSCGATTRTALPSRARARTRLGRSMRPSVWPCRRSARCVMVAALNARHG